MEVSFASPSAIYAYINSPDEHLENALHSLLRCHLPEESLRPKKMVLVSYVYINFFLKKPTVIALNT